MIKELSFPIIYHEGKKVGYGGSQEWLPKNWQRTAGCGCTSGANIAAYYAACYPSMRGLFQGNVEPFSRQEYINAMDEMFTYMRPNLFGYPYIRKFAKQFKKFCLERGVSVEPKTMVHFQRTDKAFNFVKECIDQGQPVALLILFHRGKELLKDNWHWVTITGYIEEAEQAKIILSNYGVREVVDVHVLFEVHRRNKIRMASFQLVGDQGNHHQG